MSLHVFVSRSLVPRSYLNRSSNAWRALGGPAVPVWRSMVVRAEKKLHSFRPSFGVTRAVNVCVHSQRALVSNDMQLMQLCRSVPQREQRPSKAHGQRQAVAAARAAEDFVRAHQVRRLRPRRMLQRSAGGSWFLAGGGLLARSLAVPRLVLIAALAVLAIAHLFACPNPAAESPARSSG